ncbi:MAG: tRNA (N6-threonylcarbamoyladenosine(37)-N6)-methyltransferase TrmO [Chloroflexi bacterium]|nr:tRNA (N6-threonylcarbamoyladenosine(37)-N6)-methyltransferase TrmO [Chloroflexota bacterium]
MVKVDQEHTICLEAIGVVENEVTEFRDGGWEDVESRLVIAERWAPALDGLEEFSHVMVIFWLHRVPEDKKAIMKIRPKDRQDMPLLGVFATHTQYRPNPLAVSTVRLLERRRNILKVLGLDALNGTPIIDLKPYAPRDAPRGEVKVPEWLTRL